MTELPRSEYPRPDFQRENWLCLNGEWEFSFDDNSFDRRIIVPFAYETELSGIRERSFHQTVWYRKRFRLPESMIGKRILLHFGAVDYKCRVWVNCQFVKEHVGGQTGFCADITEETVGFEENVIELRVDDDHSDLEKPRGKQYWERDPKGIFYTRTTGIWQSVWLEAVSETHLVRCLITPMFDERAVRFEYVLSCCRGTRLEIAVAFRGESAAKLSLAPESSKGAVSVRLDQIALQKWNFPEELAWTPETPNLFDVTFSVYDGEGLQDRVRSYFGMRKVSVENGKFMLNNRPYYQKLVLDQGYWEQSLMTAPADDAFVRDIELIKAMGFNGVRKHQKVEDPRFLYHADQMGLLVWGEIGSAYVYSRDYAVRMYGEWIAAVGRDYNHPCIVAWTPLNESWGVQEIMKDPAQQAHSAAMVALTRSLDTTRPIVDNDGWEHTSGDLLTVHDYSAEGGVLSEHTSSLEAVIGMLPGGRNLFVPGWSYRGQPVIVSEFGGVKFTPDADTNGAWGYCEAATAERYADKLAELTSALLRSPVVQGYCYTQLTDIETEQNGLLTYQRRPKLPVETVRKINLGQWTPR